MHQLIAALFALLVALCHHTGLSTHPAGSAQFQAQLDAAPTSSGALTILPDRYQLAHTGNAESYADSACTSCRSISASYIVR